MQKKKVTKEEKTHSDLNNAETVGNKTVDVGWYHGHGYFRPNKFHVFKWITYCKIPVQKIAKGNNSGQQV